MIAVVFPGQGSQKSGMGRALHDAFREANRVFNVVSDATGLDARAICFEYDDETLRQTQNAQLALFTCSVAAYRVLAHHGLTAQVMAGHSVGEYAALASAGVISVEDGARLVQRRGDLMSRSGNLRAGGMAAVLGLERPHLEAACKAASTKDEVAVIANDNCPGQLVISGDKAAVERAGALATEAGARKVMPLNVSGAFHSPLMEEASKSMGVALRQVEFHEGSATVYANVTASPQTDSAQWPDLLEAQLKNPVRWTETIQNMAANGVTTLVECGVGEVLCGLAKRIDRELRSFCVQDPESLQKTLAELTP